MVFRKGLVGGLHYKVHYCADADTRLITDCHATTGSAHEGPLLPERIDHLCHRLGLDVNEVIADRGYGRGPTYTALRQRGIRGYIPLHNANLGRGKQTPETFQYQKRQDRYVCPAGHYLYPCEKWEHGVLKRYQITGGHCRSCPRQSRCLPDNQKQRARFIYRSPQQQEINRVRKRQTTPAFTNKMREQRWKIEGLFAEAKQFHGLKRVRFRGLSKVQIQAYMTAITQNLKRLVTRHFWLFYSCVYRIVTKMQSLTAKSTLQIYFSQISIHSL